MPKWIMIYDQRKNRSAYISMWSLLSVDQNFFSFYWNASKHLAGKEGVFFEIAKLFIEPLSSISISNSCSTRKIGKKRLSVNSSNMEQSISWFSKSQNGPYNMKHGIWSVCVCVCLLKYMGQSLLMQAFLLCCHIYPQVFG